VVLLPLAVPVVAAGVAAAPLSAGAVVVVVVVVVVAVALPLLAVPDFVVAVSELVAAAGVFAAGVAAVGVFAAGVAAIGGAGCTIMVRPGTKTDCWADAGRPSPEAGSATASRAASLRTDMDEDPPSSRWQNGSAFAAQL
jgi:hypothetical protein